MVEKGKEVAKIAPRKKYTKKFLTSKTNNQLSKFCQKNKIPYIGLRKEFLVQNIIRWSEGANKLDDYEHKGLNDPNREGPVSHRISIKIRRFCFEYAMKGNSITGKAWGKKYSVSNTTISTWLSWPEVKDLILSFQHDTEKRITQKFIDAEEVVVDELLNIVKQKKNTDVKRKAINDFFGYRGRVNLNERSGNQVNVNQNQNSATLVQQNSVNQMTKEQIEAEIEELENMED